jgi:hypothetical protein
VCQNTLSMARASDASKLIRVKHTKDVRAPRDWVMASRLGWGRTTEQSPFPGRHPVRNCYAHYSPGPIVYIENNSVLRASWSEPVAACWPEKHESSDLGGEGAVTLLW